jgi:hypothetical protein
MLSEKYCRNLEQSVCTKQRQIQKLRNDKFLMSLAVVVGWGLFAVSQLHQVIA